jgi:hypothetical protein
MSQIQNFMNQYNLYEMSWGAYSISINGIIYTNYDDIPLDIYITFQNIKDYVVTNNNTENELRGFIVQRLFDKYHMGDTMIQIKNETDIHKLYNNNEFIIQFINFLKNQNITDVLCVIENNIVNASRPNISINEYGISQRTGEPLLDRNGVIRTDNRLELEEMDCYVQMFWDKIVTIAENII